MLKLTLPPNDPTKTSDPAFTVKCLQLINKVIQANPSIYNKD